MKNLLFTLLLALVFISCEGPMGPPGAPGEGTNWGVKTFEIKSRDWKLVSDGNGNNSFYTYSFPFRELTEFIYQSGNVNGYKVDIIDGREIQTTMPFVYPQEDTYGNKWVEVYSFDIEPGYITFNVMYSDFMVNVRPPALLFRIVMTW